MIEVVISLAVAGLICVPVLYLSLAGFSLRTRRRLMPHVLIGFALRVSLATMFALIPSLRVFHEDAASYENQAVRIARAWSGDRAAANYVERTLPQRRNTGIYFAFGAVLYVIGPYPLVLSILNALIGALSAVVLFRIGCHLFDESIARRSALYSLYFPSMIIWSSMALKDPFVGLAILMTTLFCIRLREKLSLANLLGVIVPIVAVYPVRFYLVYPLAVSVLATMVISRSGGIFSGLSKQLLLAAALIGLIVGIGFVGNAREDLELFDLQQVSNYRRGMATTANSGFSGDADVSTPIGALAFMPIGVAALMWSPFPWQMVSLRPLLTLPEMLFWWACIPALYRGVRLAVRHRFADTSPLLVCVVTLLIGYSLSMGNVGAAFRMRAQVLNLLFLFASLGYYLRVVQRKRMNESALWVQPSAA